MPSRFHLLHHRVGVGLSDPWKGENHLREKLAVGIHAGYARFDEIIETARDHMTLHHVIAALHGGGEGIEDIRCRAVQFHLNEDEEIASELGRGELRAVARDVPFPGQALDAFGRGRGGKAYPIGQFGVRQAALFLEEPEYLTVEAV